MFIVNLYVYTEISSTSSTRRIQSAKRNNFIEIQQQRKHKRHDSSEEYNPLFDSTTTTTKTARAKAKSKGKDSRKRNKDKNKNTNKHGNKSQRAQPKFRHVDEDNDDYNNNNNGGNHSDSQQSSEDSDEYVNTATKSPGI